MLGTSLLFIVLGVFITCAISETGPLFIFPTAPGPTSNYGANLVFPLGSKQVIQWQTTMKKYDMELWHQDDARGEAHMIETVYRTTDGTSTQNFTWQVQSYNTNLTYSNVFFFWASPDDPGNFTSHYFNISDTSPSSSSSVSLLTATSTSTSTATLASSSSSAKNSANTSKSSKADSDVLKIGLGVGLGVGFTLMLLAGVWIGLRIGKRRKATAMATGLDGKEPSRYSQNPLMQDGYAKPPFEEGAEVYRAQGQGHGHEVYEVHAETRPQAPPAELGG
ncbi:hypothetical protein BCR34DRAFT_573670 [Clohesyomyces aquaticus]|uniref:Mid2 domain-containing protein n=1 Tax=Clohesyomyces aquaticus TaxID=1231657 RepID=A0A1Y1YZK1_9PLEO|nr:hypothetical protein BCR34DRAFT_573670 [Clohesyomyces aquaticus]